jgi:hypothetical protein
VVDDADVRIPQLRDALERAGLPFDQLRVAEPSIEDVFVALLENDGAGR